MNTLFNYQNMIYIFSVFTVAYIYQVPPVVAFIGLLFLVIIAQYCCYRVKYPNLPTELIQLSILNTVTTLFFIYYIIMIAFLFVFATINIVSLVDFNGISEIFRNLLCAFFMKVFIIKQVECSTDLPPSLLPSYNTSITGPINNHFSVNIMKLGIEEEFLPTLQHQPDEVEDLAILVIPSTTVDSVPSAANVALITHPDSEVAVESVIATTAPSLGTATNHNSTDSAVTIMATATNHNSTDSAVTIMATETNHITAENILAVIPTTTSDNVTTLAQVNNVITLHDQQVSVTSLQDIIQNSSTIFANSNVQVAEVQYNLLAGYVAFDEVPQNLHPLARRILNEAELIEERRSTMNSFNRLLFDLELFSKYGSMTPAQIAYLGIRTGNIEMVVESMVKQFVNEELRQVNGISVFSRIYTVALHIGKHFHTKPIPFNGNPTALLLENSPTTFSNALVRLTNTPLYYTSNFITNFSISTVLSGVGTTIAMGHFLYTGDEIYLQEMDSACTKGVETLRIEGGMSQPETFKEVFTNYMKFILNNPMKVLTILGYYGPYISYGGLSTYVLSPLLSTGYSMLSTAGTILQTSATGLYNFAISSYHFTEALYLQHLATQDITSTTIILGDVIEFCVDSHPGINVLPKLV